MKKNFVRVICALVLVVALVVFTQTVSGLDFLQPQKPILTYVVQGSLRPQEETVTEINKYLRKSHADYQIEFVSLPMENYRQELKNYLDRGEAADLIFTGVPEDSGLDYVLEGNRLLDLSSYLKTEEGQTLYDALPEICWENVERDGAIYGVMPTFVTSEPIVYYVNKSLMEQYGLSEKDFNTSIRGLETMLRKVKEGEGDAFIPLRLQSARQLLYTDGYALFQDLFAVNRATEEVVLSTEIPEVKDNLDAAMRFAQDGLLSRMLITQLNDCLVYCAYDDGFPKEYSELLTADGTPAKIDEDYLRIVPGEGKYYCDNRVVMATGVSSASQYQSEALDFLTKMMSDQKLTNFMSYGVEGKEYSLTEDGRILPLQKEGSDLVDSSWRLLFGNRYLATPLHTESIEPSAAAEFASKVGISPLFASDIHIEEMFPEEIDRFLQVITDLDAQIDQAPMNLAADSTVWESVLQESDFDSMAKKVAEKIEQGKA